MHQQRFAIGECAAQMGRQEMPHFYACSGLQREAQFKAFGVLAAKSNGMNLADAQRRKVVQDRSRAAGLAADVDDVAHAQAGFDGDFLFARINLKIPIQAEIADDCQAEAGVAAGDLLESSQVHGLRIVVWGECHRGRFRF